MSFSDWLSSTSFSLWIQETNGAIAAIQIVHILTLATLCGLALNLALRLTGRGLTRESLSSLARRMTKGIWICLAILLVSGTLLIVAEPGRTVTNPAFYLKVALIAVAVVLMLAMASAARRDPPKPTGLHVAGAVLSLAVWAAIIVAGRMIAYTDSF